MYPSDLSEEQWRRVRRVIGEERKIDRPGPRQADLREVVNAINYRWRTGCVWRMLPHDLPPWPTVYAYFDRWRKAGLLPAVRDAVLHAGQGKEAEWSRRCDPRRPQLDAAAECPAPQPGD